MGFLNNQSRYESESKKVSKSSSFTCLIYKNYYAKIIKDYKRLEYPKIKSTNISTIYFIHFFLSRFYIFTRNSEFSYNN